MNGCIRHRKEDIMTVASGSDPHTVADRLGHASPSFTLATYAHAASWAQETGRGGC